MPHVDFAAAQKLYARAGDVGEAHAVDEDVFAVRPLDRARTVDRAQSRFFMMRIDAADIQIANDDVPRALQQKRVQTDGNLGVKIVRALAGHGAIDNQTARAVKIPLAGPRHALADVPEDVFALAKAAGRMLQLAFKLDKAGLSIQRPHAHCGFVPFVKDGDLGIANVHILRKIGGIDNDARQLLMRQRTVPAAVRAVHPFDVGRAPVCQRARLGIARTRPRPTADQQHRGIRALGNARRQQAVRVVSPICQDAAAAHACAAALDDKAAVLGVQPNRPPPRFSVLCGDEAPRSSSIRS